MFKETISYEDFDGNARTEDFYFNLTKAELMEMQLSMDGGLEKKIQKIVAAQDVKQIIGIFKELVLKAYGVKSDDGKRFMKSDEIRAEFEQTQAYSDLFMKLATDDKYAAKFINGVIPKQVAEEMAKANTPELAVAE